MYTALYNKHAPFTLHFAPIVPADGNLKLSVCPDFFPENAIDFEESHVEITGKGMVKSITKNLGMKGYVISLPQAQPGSTLQVQVTFYPNTAWKVQSLSDSVLPQIHSKGKIAVVMESHFDELEIQYLEKILPKEGFTMELVSFLWDNKMMEFQGNECHDPFRVYKDIKSINIDDYVAFYFVGAYCMDRLRYEAHPRRGERNESAVVNLVRKLAAAKKLTATICHSLWAFVCAPEVIRSKKVTCAHNIIDDVKNAGAIVMYEPNGIDTAKVYEDDWLISGRNREFTKEVVDCLLRKINEELRYKKGKRAY